MIDYNKDNVRVAKMLRKNMTAWERKLWYTFLREYPVRFQRQKAIGKYVVDFYCAKARLVIELDGSGHFLQKQMEFDQKRTAELEAEGLLVLRFLNTDVENNFLGVCETIDATVAVRCSS